jgi:outer membrane protein OmpA-like peptidoglycan-associated protein
VFTIFYNYIQETPGGEHLQMIEKKISTKNLLSGISGLKPGETYHFTIVLPSVRVIEMEDVHFHHDSVVLLPGAIDADPLKGLSGMQVLAAALKHAKKVPGDKLIITGHADTSGDKNYNNTISKQRADNVLACLTGDRDTWVVLCNNKHKTEDYQFICKWLYTNKGWSCDPGDIDNVHGSKTTDALKKLQAGYNSDYGKSIAVDGKIGKETWGAIFDIYMDDLKKALSATDAQVTEYRESLNYIDLSIKTAGCGESHPIEEKYRDNFRSTTNRRVEMLFFNTGEEPSLLCNKDGGCEDPTVCEIYTVGIYARVFVDEEGDGAFSDLIIQWPDSFTSRLPSDLKLTVICEDKK